MTLLIVNCADVLPRLDNPTIKEKRKKEMLNLRKREEGEEKETPAMLCVFSPIGYPFCWYFLTVSEAWNLHFGLLMSDMAARIVFVMRLFVGVFEVGVT